MSVDTGLAKSVVILDTGVASLMKNMHASTTETETVLRYWDESKLMTLSTFLNYKISTCSILGMKFFMREALQFLSK